MDELTTTAPNPAPAPPEGEGRWATIAWAVSSLLLIVLVVGIWMQVGSGRAGANLANAIISGTRPVAPSLPTTPIKGSGGAGIPDWYRSSGAKQDPSPDGKVLVVNWWASWCGPCREEAEDLKKIAAQYDGRVTVVGLNAGSQDLESAARAFARRYKLEFTLVRGNRADETAWGVGGFPETFVVGTDGRISSFVNGPIDLETVRGLIDAELRENRS